MSTGTEKHCIGLAGEYLAAGQLCMKGWIANLTSKNCPAFDIIVIDPKNNKTVTVQVKSTKNQNSYTTGLSHLRISELDEKITCPFIYVNMKNDTVRYFIVPKEGLD